jgi:pyrrolidone-carboxylate peptidase
MLDTSTPLARAQWEACVAFARAYRARRTERIGRRRVLLTGFTRFGAHLQNASGRMVSLLAPAAPYVDAPLRAGGHLDPPEASTSVGDVTLPLSDGREVEVRAMILPVAWDLAPALVAAELDAFGPDFVLMCGVATEQQPMCIELGAQNRAALRYDGSEALRPLPASGDTHGVILSGVPDDVRAMPLHLSWRSVRSAAREAVEQLASTRQAGTPLSARLHGVRLAAFPRECNSFVCNNLAYVTNFLMAHPGRRITVLETADGGHDLVVERDLRRVPRCFSHWPSALDGAHIEAGAKVLTRMIEAQLRCLDTGQDPPTPGDNAYADPGDAPA